MNFRFITAIGMFIASCIIGFGLRQTVTVVQAAPVIPSPIEMPKFPIVNSEENKSVDKIDVEVDLSTLEVSVKGTTDAIVNVKTIGEPKPVVKWRTKVIEKEVASGYPYIKSIGITPDSIRAISPLSKVKSYGKQSSYTKTNDTIITYH